MTLALNLITAAWAVGIATHASKRAAMGEKERKEELTLLLIGSFFIAIIWMLKDVPL